MIKLPEPEVIGVEEIDYGTFEVRKGYTEPQMRQAINDALEEAAQKCLGLGHWVHPEGCAEAIRNLKEDV